MTFGEIDIVRMWSPWKIFSPTQTVFSTFVPVARLILVWVSLIQIVKLAMPVGSVALLVQLPAVCVAPEKSRENHLLLALHAQRDTTLRRNQLLAPHAQPEKNCLMQQLERSHRRVPPVKQESSVHLKHQPPAPIVKLGRPPLLVALAAILASPELITTRLPCRTLAKRVCQAHILIAADLKRATFALLESTLLRNPLPAPTARLESTMAVRPKDLAPNVDLAATRQLQPQRSSRPVTTANLESRAAKRFEKMDATFAFQESPPLLLVFLNALIVWQAPTRMTLLVQVHVKNATLANSQVQLD